MAICPPVCPPASGRSAMMRMYCAVTGEASWTPDRPPAVPSYLATVQNDDPLSETSMCQLVANAESDCSSEIALTDSGCCRSICWIQRYWPVACEQVLGLPSSAYEGSDPGCISAWVPSMNSACAGLSSASSGLVPVAA